MAWQLRQIENEPEWAQDDSGLYCYVAWTPKQTVRVDLMETETDMPVESFESANINALRKAIMQKYTMLSAEHASYIGAEIVRCYFLKDKYIQE